MSRVLLADDSPQALRLAEQILTSQGIEVVSVTDGDVALRRLADVNPDLVISDLYLTTKTAFDIARFMKSQPDYKDVPIIFASTPVDVFDEQDALNAGADVILRKPFEASALLGSVEKLLRQSEAARAGRSGVKVETLDRHTVKAAVTVALEAAMPTVIEELTTRVLLALSLRR